MGHSESSHDKDDIVSEWTASGKLVLVERTYMYFIYYSPVLFYCKYSLDHNNINININYGKHTDRKR